MRVVRERLLSGRRANRRDGTILSILAGKLGRISRAGLVREQF